MARSPDDDAARRKRRLGDHVASKLDALRSGPLRELARDIMIVSSVPSDASVLVSMLRASFGHAFTARQVRTLAEAIASVAKRPPNESGYPVIDCDIGIENEGLGRTRTHPSRRAQCDQFRVSRPEDPYGSIRIGGQTLWRSSDSLES